MINKIILRIKNLLGDFFLGFIIKNLKGKKNLNISIDLITGKVVKVYLNLAMVQN